MALVRLLTYDNGMRMSRFVNEINSSTNYNM